VIVTDLGHHRITGALGAGGIEDLAPRLCPLEKTAR
jgi:hypothetical protein